MEEYPVAPRPAEARARARQHPGDAEAQWDLARSIIDSDEAAPVTDPELAEALDAIERAIRQASKVARFHWMRGYLLQRWSARLARRAADSLRTAVELEPDRPKNHFQYIAALRQASRVDHAVRYYLGRAKADPGDPANYIYLAFAYYQARQYAEATATAEDGLKLAPADPFLWYVHGEGLIGSGRALEGEHSLRQVVELDATFVDAHYTLIDLLERQERWAELARELDALTAKLDPDDPSLPSLREKRAALPA